MKFTKGKTRPASSGRQKGTPNRVTTEAKTALALAFEGLGGVDALIEWAKDNQTEFYKLYAKLLPVQVAGEGGGPVQIAMRPPNPLEAMEELQRHREEAE